MLLLNIFVRKKVSSVFIREILLSLLGGLMTKVKTIKISEETYALLSEIAEEFQIRLKRPVSLDEAMRY